MRHRTLIFFCTSLFAIAGFSIAQDGGTRGVVGNVFLQDTTPGIAQVGHANIKGTFRAGQVNVASVNSTIPIIGNNNATGIPGIGGSFSSAGADGTALRGTATNMGGFGYGVYGESRADKGVGVYGFSANSIGLQGRSTGQQGIGVRALADVSFAPALRATNLANGLSAIFDGNIQGRNLNGVTVLSTSLSSGGADIRVQGPDTGDFSGMVAGSNFGAVTLERNSFINAQMVIGSDGIGRVNAQVKNFVQPDPDDRTRDIVYACVEGPEAAAYVRGTGRIVNGTAKILLPRHFQNVATAEGMTVQVTPLSSDSEGLSVVLKSLTGFEVCELRHGRGNYSFDWEVKAVRRGLTTYKVYRPWDETLPPGSNRQAAMQGRFEQARKLYGITYPEGP